MLRIQHVALSTATPVGPTRTAAKRAEDGAPTAKVVSSGGGVEAGTHPDEIAAAQLQKAAGAAQAARVVAAENQRASASVRDEIDPSRVPAFV